MTILTVRHITTYQYKQPVSGEGVDLLEKGLGCTLPE